MSDKQKILTIAGYKFLPPTDGGKRCIYYFNSYLAEHFDIDIASTSNNEEGNYAFRLSKFLGTSKLRYINPFLFFSLRKKIKKEKIKLLMLEQTYFGWLGILLKTFTGVRLIIHHHNIEGLRFKSLKKWWAPMLLQYEKYTCKFADINFFITKEDADYATKYFKVPAAKSAIAPYGVTIEESPSAEERKNCKNILLEKYGLTSDTFILLFAAAYNYTPNLDALKIILDKINPSLYSDNLNYSIIICGGGLPSSLDNLDEYKQQKIIYAGFVDDINLYYKGADLFLNPITEGGGIKTKIVEALAFGTSVVSMKSGAAGVDPDICDGKLMIVEDDDIAAFAKLIENEMKSSIYIETPKSFYNFFSWRGVAERVKYLICNTELIFKAENV